MTIFFVPGLSIVISSVVEYAGTWTICIRRSWCACRTIIKRVYISHIATEAKAIVFIPNGTMRICLAVFINASRSLVRGRCWRICWCLCWFITTSCRYITISTRVFRTSTIIRDFPLLIIVKVPSIMKANAIVIKDLVVTVIVSLYGTRNT